MAQQQRPEEIPLLSAEERQQATSVDTGSGTGAPAASGVRQRTNADPPAYSGSGSGAGSSSTSSTGRSGGSKRSDLVGKAEADVKGVAALVSGGVQSGTWLYPLRGVAYLLTREST